MPTNSTWEPYLVLMQIELQYHPWKWYSGLNVEEEKGLSSSNKLQEKGKQIMGRAPATKNKIKPRSMNRQKCMGRKGMVTSLGGEVIWEVKYKVLL